MKESDIKNNIIIIALSNLIDTYSLLLDKANNDPNNYSLDKDDIEYIQDLINMAKYILEEMSANNTIEKPIDRPEWQNL